MRTDLRKLLDTIDTYLAEHPNKNASQELWAVLTALRGPDVLAGSNQKLATTAVIRAVAFPKTAAVSHAEGGRVCASMINDTEYLVGTRKALPYYEGHFNSHVREAFKALGLMWDIANSPKEKI